MTNLVNTEGRLYVLVHAWKPTALVLSEPIAELENVDWSGIGLPVFEPGDWPRHYDGPTGLHAWLHDVSGNECKGRRYTRIMRNGKDTQFGGLVRLGYDPPMQRREDTGAPIVLGCADTPCMDVDAVRVEDGVAIALVELKRHDERLTSFQRGVLRNARKMGVEYVEEREA